jgi:hypothetical protein
MSATRTDLYYGIFELHVTDGLPRVTRSKVAPPVSIPDPCGRQLRISTIQAGTPAICPACSSRAHGGYVSFEDDLRMAYACPLCQQLVWIRGA